MADRSPGELYRRAREQVDRAVDFLDDSFGEYRAYQAAKDVYKEFHDHFDVYFPLYTGARIEAFSKSTAYPVFEEWLNPWGGDKILHAGFSYGLTGLTWRAMAYTESFSDRAIDRLDELEASMVDTATLQDQEELESLLEDYDVPDGDDLAERYGQGALPADVEDAAVDPEMSENVSWTRQLLTKAIESDAEDRFRSWLSDINDVAGDPHARAAAGFLVVGAFSIGKEFVYDSQPDGLDIGANYIGWGLYMARQHYGIDSWTDWGKAGIGKHTPVDADYLTLSDPEDEIRMEEARGDKLRDGMAWLDETVEETAEEAP